MGSNAKLWKWLFQVEINCKLQADLRLASACDLRMIQILLLVSSAI